MLQQGFPEGQGKIIKVGIPTRNRRTTNEYLRGLGAVYNLSRRGGKEKNGAIPLVTRNKRITVANVCPNARPRVNKSGGGVGGGGLGGCGVGLGVLFLLFWFGVGFLWFVGCGCGGGVGGGVVLGGLCGGFGGRGEEAGF